MEAKTFFHNVFLSKNCSKHRGRTGKGKKSIARIGRKWKVWKSQTLLKDSVVTTCTDIEEPSMSTRSDWISSIEVPCDWTSKSVYDHELRLCYIMNHFCSTDTVLKIHFPMNIFG